MNPPGTCRDLQEQLTLLVDGRLDSTDAQAIRRHAGSCSACSRRLDELRALRAEIGALSYPEPSSDALWASVVARLECEDPRVECEDHARPLVPVLLRPPAGPMRDLALAAASFILGLALWFAWPTLSSIAPSTIGAPSSAGVVTPPPIALTVGDFVRAVTVGESPDRFWSRYGAIDALPERIADALDFPPTVRSELPGGFRLQRIKLLKDACCYTLHLRYESADGVLDVFQCHDDHPIEFGPATVQRGEQDGVAFTDLVWPGALVRGRVLRRDDVNIVVVGDLRPQLADDLTRELSRASD